MLTGLGGGVITGYFQEGLSTEASLGSSCRRAAESCDQRVPSCVKGRHQA